MRQLRIFKVDTAYPLQVLGEKKSQIDITSLSFEDYHDWVISLRHNVSDFYQRAFEQLGHTAQEYLMGDLDYAQKASLNISLTSHFRRTTEYLGAKKNPLKRFDLLVLRDRIKRFNPDLILVREHSTIPSAFWSQFSAPKVCRISSSIPKIWNPRHFDAVITDIPEFTNFLRINGIPTFKNRYAFDPRVLPSKPKTKKDNIIFIGTVGNSGFFQRTKTLDFVAKSFPEKFQWFGRMSGSITPALEQSYKGTCAGQVMYNHYSSALICINDYIDIAPSLAVNQRLYESMGCACLMITRKSESLKELKTNDLLTYQDFTELKVHIQWALENQEKAAEMGRNAQSFIMANHNYEQECDFTIRELERLNVL